MIRTTKTWRPEESPAPLAPAPTALAHSALSLAELQEEIAHLRAELAYVRGELAHERAQRPPAISTTREFRAPPLPAPAPAPTPPPRAVREVREVKDDGPPIAPFSAQPTGPTFMLPRDQGIDFGAVKQLSAEELDALPYGLITLDAEGRVLHYNDTESRMVGLPKHKVLGRRFFGEVAPCARVREFEGRFQELVRDPYRVRVQTFDFVFRFANGDQQVTIVMTPAKERGQYHMALLRRADAGYEGE